MYTTPEEDYQEFLLCLNHIYHKQYGLLKEALTNNPLLVYYHDLNGNTLLHHATQQHDIALIKLLADNSADLVATNDNGEEALHMALLQSNAQEIITLFQSILTEKLYPSAPLHPLSLHQFALSGDCKSFINFLRNQTLNEMTAICAWQDQAGFTAFHIAMALGHENIIQESHRYFLENNLAFSDFADIFKLKTNRELRPIFLALLHNHNSSVEYCLEKFIVAFDEIPLIYEQIKTISFSLDTNPNSPKTDKLKLAKEKNKQPNEMTLLIDKNPLVIFNTDTIFSQTKKSLLNDWLKKWANNPLVASNILKLISCLQRKKYLTSKSYADTVSLNEILRTPAALIASNHKRLLSHFTATFFDFFLWLTEKSWSLILGIFLSKSLIDYALLPAWQQRRRNFFKIIIGKELEERLASYITDPRLLGSWLGGAATISIVAGIVSVSHHKRNISIQELEKIKYRLIQHKHNASGFVLHTLLELLEVATLFGFLIATPAIVISLFTLKVYHLFHHNPLEELLNTLLWNQQITVNQRRELTDLLIRHCYSRSSYTQAEAIALLGQLVNSISRKQIKSLQKEDPELAATLDYCKSQSIETLKKLSWIYQQQKNHSPITHLTNVINQYHQWRLGLVTHKTLWLRMLMFYLASRTPTILPIILFIKTVIEGITEAAYRQEEAEHCEAKDWLWRYAESAGEYVCSPCADLPIPYRYLHTNDDCIRSFMHDARSLEQWNIVLNRLNFQNFSSLDLSAQTTLIINQQLPTLLQTISYRLDNINEVILNNKQESVYQLSNNDLIAIANFTQQYQDFYNLEMQYQSLNLFNRTELARFAKQLNPNLTILVLANNQLGLADTNDFFKYLPTELQALGLYSNDLNNTAGDHIASAFSRFNQLAVISFGNNKNLTDASMVKLIQQWHQHPDLFTWDFSYTGIGDKSAIELATQTQHLPEKQELILDINNCDQLTDVGGTALAQTLLSNNSFSKLLVTGNKGFTEKTLEAFSKTIPDAHELLIIGVNAKTNKPGTIVNYLDALKTRTELQILDLHDLSLSASSITELATLIHHLPNLEKIYLDNTGLTDSKLLQLIPALAKANITWLSLSNNSALSDDSIIFFMQNAPSNLSGLELNQLNLTSNIANVLGKLIHTRSITSLSLANNRLGKDFADNFANYLPESSLEHLNLAGCELADQGALKIAEVLTEYQIPNDWLGSLDTYTLRALAKGNPGTNLTWINLASNNLTNISARRFCEVIAGTDIYSNNLLLKENPGIDQAIWKRCLYPATNSAGSRLIPAGPYVWLFQQIKPFLPDHQTTYQTFNDLIINSSLFSAPIFLLAKQFIFIASQSIGLTLFKSTTTYLFRKTGISESNAETVSSYLHYWLILGLFLWHSPYQALITLIATSTLYRLTTHQQTAQFLNIMLTIFTLSLTSQLNKNASFESLAMQFIINMLGALAGQLVSHQANKYIAKLATSNNYSFWQKRLSTEVDSVVSGQNNSKIFNK